MVMQVRIRDVDGSNLTVLDRVDNKVLSEPLNSGEETFNFEISKNDPKAELLNPETGGYARIWEVWDTETNQQLNTGPIRTISDADTTWKIEGKGRSAYLEDIITSKQTFYKPIDQFIDELRFENVAGQPRTTTLVHDGDINNTDENTFFGGAIPDETLRGLSVRTKDNAIDEDTGFIPFGASGPPKGNYYQTKSFWAGTNKTDALVVDLGAEYDIARLGLIFPWWGGASKWNDRTYDFSIAYATEGSTLTDVQGRDSSAFTTLYSVSGNRIVTEHDHAFMFNLGTTYSGTGFGLNFFNIATDQSGPIDTRYLRVKFENVYAWYGNAFDTDAAADAWDYQCDPNYSPGDNPLLGSRAGIMAGLNFNDRDIEPANDCFASIVEMGAYKEVIPLKKISPLAIQKIDNNNLQITYYHAVASGETKTTSNGYRTFEPGTFFRNFTVTYSGATSNYTKFFSTDCTNCYASGFHFGILDQNNNAVYLTDNTSGINVALKTGVFSRLVTMKGASNAVVTSVDAWIGQTDPLSYGGSYSYSETTNDYAIIHFRGQSFKWYATVPSGKTGATVKIEYRKKTSGFSYSGGFVAANAWESWNTLENSYALPSDIHAEKVYEITYESGTLAEDTIYEIKITNLDGNYCSIDSIEGYWSASFTMYNEDSTRLRLSREDAFKQIYDSRFSDGSMYKWNTSGASVVMDFEGDRFIILSAKGRYHGKLRLLLYRRIGTYGLYDPGTQEHVFIPGGDLSDGSLTIDLDTGKVGAESTQAVIFDSNEYFPNGLTWGQYFISLSYRDIQTFLTSAADQSSENFLTRCSNCSGSTGTITANRFVYLDAIGVHEKTGLSVKFENKTNLEQLNSVAEAIQVDWKVTEEGLQFEPRIGTDTNYILREGDNTVVNYDLTYDVSNVASILLSNGSDIDGLPLFTITEDKKNRAILGRTIMRQTDFRDVGDYQQLVGLSRGELRKRRAPEKRITVSHISRSLPLDRGDSFILFTKKLGAIRVRIQRKERAESSTSGTVFNLECVAWPTMV